MYDTIQSSITKRGWVPGLIEAIQSSNYFGNFILFGISAFKKIIDFCRFFSCTFISDWMLIKSANHENLDFVAFFFFQRLNKSGKKKFFLNYFASASCVSKNACIFFSDDEAPIQVVSSNPSWLLLPGLLSIRKRSTCLFFYYYLWVKWISLK